MIGIEYSYCLLSPRAFTYNKDALLVKDAQFVMRYNNPRNRQQGQRPPESLSCGCYAFSSRFCLRFSLRLSFAFFCISFLPLSFFPFSPIFSSPYSIFYHLQAKSIIITIACTALYHISLKNQSRPGSRSTNRRAGLKIICVGQLWMWRVSGMMCANVMVVQ